jgi:thioredoxin 1
MKKSISIATILCLAMTGLCALENPTIDRDVVEESTKKTTLEVLEITQANFQEEILESKKPVVIDIYSNSCQPCRLMESTFKEMSLEYKGEIRFAKINCETEIELARKYNVTQLPTFLFIRPGKETPALQVKGFTSKKNFQAKISEFLQKE